MYNPIDEHLRRRPYHHSFESVRVSFMPARVGGTEELLLIEENLRRALGISA